MAELFASPGRYDEIMGRWSAKLAPLFLEFVQVESGRNILDVGCGTGALLKALRERDKEAMISGIDTSRAFIDHCNSVFSGEKMEFQTGSALALPYSEAAFDYTLSLLLLMFVSNADRAAREMRRVTKPGGTVAACTWHAEGLRIDRVFFEEAYQLDVAARSKAEKLRHNSREGQLSSLWTRIGLRNVIEAPVEISMDFLSFDDYWIPMAEGTGPAKAYLSSLHDHLREQLRENVRLRLLGNRPDGCFSLPAKALAVRGTVPK